ncbi:MAG: hypothetical protein QXL78_05055 [Methanocellales archaeon]
MINLIKADVLVSGGMARRSLLLFIPLLDEGVFEIKWKELSYAEARSIILPLIKKSRVLPIGGRRYGIIAKKIEVRRDLKLKKKDISQAT